MVDSAYDIIKEKQVDVDQFTARLANLPLEHQEVHREFLKEINTEMRLKGTALLNIWLKLSSYWNFLNYFLLEQVIRKFGDDHLKFTLEDYKKLKHFRCKTRLSDFAKCFKQVRIPSDVSEETSKKIAMKLGKCWDECTLEDLENLTGKFTQKLFFSSFALKLEDITTGCIYVTWSIPAGVGASLQENLENIDIGEFRKEHGITSITIDGEECKYSAVKKYSAYLKDLYSHKEGKNLAPFKLARIEKQELDRRECDGFTKSTLRGDQDDVVYTKRPMNEEIISVPTYSTGYKTPRVILIEGAPGVGKTTFSEQFCHKWSQQQISKRHKLLVLLPLRDNRVRSARNVGDLFQHPQLQQAIAEEVESSGGEGVALWLEAWDELGEEMRNKSSIFLDLVHGRVLPKATVIITSRPWATKNLRENSSIEIDQHIEIVSTPNIQFSRVLREDKVKPDNRAKFIDYVNSNPSIKAAMHTPVTADIVAEVFQWSRDTKSTPPTTMTRLYTAFTCKLLMQHLSKSPKIRSLEELSADVKGRLLEVCRLAWEGVVEQQLTFSSKVAGGDTLGLMCGVKELYGGELSFHFIHLSLQEFLSAYHITQLPLDKQEQVIRQHVLKGHLNMVVRFYFGLANHKHNTFTAGIISEQLHESGATISEQLHGSGATAYHWLFEGGQIEKLGSGIEVQVKTSYSWSPLDY